MLQEVEGSTRPTTEIQEAFIKLYASLDSVEDIKTLKQIEEYLIARLNDKFSKTWEYGTIKMGPGEGRITIDDPWKRDDDYWVGTPPKDPRTFDVKCNIPPPPEMPPFPECNTVCTHLFKKKNCRGCYPKS